MNKAYASYSPINQKWVKQIPSHWNARRMKAVFAMRKERNNPIVTENILSLTAKQGVVPYTEKDSAGGNKPKSDLTQYNVCHENDLLVNCMNVVSGAAGVSRYYGAISPVYYAFYPHRDENIWYYHYIFRLLPFQRSLVGLGKGILMHESEDGTLTSVRMRISMDYLGNVLLPVPPRTEQDQIVKFLDWKVSGINKLVHIRKQQIGQLIALKKSTVKKTVTTGVLPHAELKKSGVDWLGNIPVDWDIQKVKRVMVVEHGRDPITTGDVPVYGSGTSTFKTCGEYKEGPAVLLGRKGSISNPQYVEGRYWNVDTAFNAYPKSDFSIRYFFYLSQCFDYDYYTTQTAIPSMTQTDYRNILIPCPPAEEQKEIAAFLDERCSAIDSQIAKIQSLIDTLNELKTRLIADVVTGKIDVRDIVIPEYEFVDEEADSESNSEEDLDEADVQED